MSGSEWMRSSKKEMSPFGERVADMLGEVFAGIYHVSNEVWKADFTGKKYIAVTFYENGGFATYDSDHLTRLVLLAHERNIRVCVRAATHAYLKIEFMEVDRSGFFADRHPSLAEALLRVRLAEADEKAGYDHTDPDQNPWILTEGDIACNRCHCCTMVDVECPNCGGTGLDGHDCGEDCCSCIDPEENVKCAVCKGKGGWMECGGHCDENGKHEEKKNDRQTDSVSR